MTPLPPPHLPYPPDALEPYLGEGAVKLHLDLWGGYQQRANKLIRAKKAGKLAPGGDEALAFNHDGYLLHQFFFENLAPVTPGRQPKVPRHVTAAFGKGSRELKRELVAAGMSIQGSGWVALSLALPAGPGYGELAVHTIPNHRYNWARFRPLLVLDVWEHAYVPDYGGDRKVYLGELLRLVNWAEVLRRLP
jgi:Fe-Mn family superoxide dismutase